jgi:hypothetical protein
MPFSLENLFYTASPINAQSTARQAIQNCQISPVDLQSYLFQHSTDLGLFESLTY